jgi:hypothetical protein
LEAWAAMFFLAVSRAAMSLAASRASNVIGSVSIGDVLLAPSTRSWLIYLQQRKQSNRSETERLNFLFSFRKLRVTS